MLSRTAKRRREEILRAAEDIIVSKGFAKASMDVIAERAGCTRRTLYSYFSSKDVMFAELFERHAVSEKYARVQKSIEGLDFETALFQGFKLSVQLMRKDALMHEFMYGGGAYWFQQQMMDDSSPIFQRTLLVNLSFWGGVIDDARLKGYIDTEVSNEQMMKWYGTVQYMMVVRVKTTQAEADFLLKKFIIPSLVNHAK